MCCFRNWNSLFIGICWCLKQKRENRTSKPVLSLIAASSIKPGARIHYTTMIRKNSLFCKIICIKKHPSSFFMNICCLIHEKMRHAHCVTPKATLCPMTLTHVSWLTSPMPFPVPQAAVAWHAWLRRNYPCQIYEAFLFPGTISSFLPASLSSFWPGLSCSRMQTPQITGRKFSARYSWQASHAMGIPILTSRDYDGKIAKEGERHP